MTGKIRLKEDYQLAKCCSPSPGDQVVGYHSHDNFLKVHRRDCANLRKAEPARLVSLTWDDILAKESFVPGRDFEQLDELDFQILKHHRDYGVDYSLMVAKMLSVAKQAAFDRHTKLRNLRLLERVDPVMIQYRKGVVDNKWIKHRNHTYYKLTKKGKNYLEHYLAGGDDAQ